MALTHHFKLKSSQVDWNGELSFDDFEVKEYNPSSEGVGYNEWLKVKALFDAFRSLTQAFGEIDNLKISKVGPS